MRISDAKRIAEKITDSELAEMFLTAKENIKDWTKVSVINKGLTKGAIWNFLAKDFEVNKYYHFLAKTNMIREFGEFLPKHLKPAKERKFKIKPRHEEPIF